VRAINTFKVDDEGGKVSLYREMKRGGNLRVGQGGVTLIVKLVGYVEAGQAGEIPTFKEFVSGGSAGGSGERDAA